MDPKETDFLGLKALLGNYLDGALFSSSELCDAIIKQSTVGTVVKAQGAGDENDPIAVMSVMNLEEKKEMPFVKEIAAHLKGKCPKDLKKKLDEAFTEKGVGMIINERVINIPQETAPPLVDGLFDEIGWATEDEPTKELRIRSSSANTCSSPDYSETMTLSRMNRTRSGSGRTSRYWCTSDLRTNFSISWQSGLSHGRRKAPRIRMTLTI